MGFSSALQGRAAHEALIVRQDAELRLMETMKRSIQMKAKCDKEYAISLTAVAQQGLKIDRADDMQGSLITKSWRSYMDDLDQQAKQFKTNAELLEVVCEKIAHLSQDKRKARKAYQEEHAKIAARLNHLTDEVVRKKSEYQKHLEGYKALRTRFEEHYIKSGRGGRKLDDVRDKYQKACRKLHLTHNEYVLSITEAIEVEKDFRTVLLPGLLEHQQSVQESFILLWRNILQEASQHSDLTSEKFSEIQKRIDNVINSINPSEEYREFTEKHKTSPTTPLVFQFDDTLIEDIPGKLQSSTLTVDNLTVDWLRSRLIELELSVKECQEKQLKMIEHVNGGSPIANGSNTTNGSISNGIQSNKDSQNRQSKDLNALRCQEKQKQKLVDMIKCALNEVGCEELPSGCDDHLTLDQNFIENGFNNDQQASNSNHNNVSIMNELMRRGGVLTLLRGPFKRKSTPQPTTPTARSRTQRLAKLQPRSQSLGSLSVNSSPAKYEPITNPLRMAASMEANNCHGLHVDVDQLVGSIVVFERGTGEVLPKLRRTQNSMLCLLEEPKLSPLIKPATVALCTATNTNNFYNNNNNIYSELEMDSSVVGLKSVPNDCESVASGDVPPPTPQLNADELLRRRQMHVKIEINRADSIAEKRIETEMTTEKDVENITAQPKISVTSAEPVKNSIDAHLDKIDALNRALDDRLKRNLPHLALQRPSHEVDLNAIEPSDSAPMENSAKRASTSSSADSHHDFSTPSSSSDSNHSFSAGKCVNSKKRSMSFSNKSISAILTNIKEFSRSPLARMHRTQHSTLAEDGEINDILEGVAELSIDTRSTAAVAPLSPLSNNELNTDTVPNTNNNNNTHSTISTTTTTSISPTAITTVNNSTTIIPAKSESSNIESSKLDSSKSDTSKSESSKLESSKLVSSKLESVKLESSKLESSKSESSKLKFKVPKIQKKSKAIRNTFRSKLMNFQIKRGKLCKTCTKRRRIHPSKSVFDFAKEFNLTDDDFCICPSNTKHDSRLMINSSTNTEHRHPFDSMHSSADAEDEGELSDDVLSMKEHCYCVPSLSTSMSLSTNRPLYEEEWFHGVLPREEVVRLLNNDGDFLVRETIRNEESQIVLSVCWNGHKHFIVQTTADGHFRFEGPPFPSIQELIMHQYQSELPVTGKSGSILRRPVCRERWELSNDDVVLCEKIGRGNFGDVYKAKLKSTKEGVAVKTCRMTLPDEQKRKFLQEGRILKQYDHPNIVKLIGICVQKQPIMIVMELVPGGSLLNYLRKNSNQLSNRQQMGMCRDAAAGMRYLESKNCIHRDLAARNCLVDFENCVKISDFGMSREEEEYIVSDGMKQIPVKWTAPEALNFGKYTSLCDVWSYGILMWEIFSKGDTPYSGMSNSRARERIDTGYRMPTPENTPAEMYRLMLKCWAAEAESRPHFDEIYNVVDALIIRLDNSH